MLYHAPTGSTDPNAGYVGKNLAAGQEGSKVPPAAIETPQRELVAVIAEGGRVPTDTDLKQVMRAIRSGRMNVFTDQGTPNALIATPLTPFTAYEPGTLFCVVLAHTVTGATTLNVSGLGALNVTFPGGGPLQAYDYLAGELLIVRVNGSATGFVALSPINSALIDTALVRTVHGVGAAFGSLNAAFAWLNRRRITATGSVTFQLAAGVGANKVVYNDAIFVDHPDGARVTIAGQPLAGALPAPMLLTVTGNGPAPRASDTVTNLALLRNVYQTEVYFQGGVGLTNLATINIQDVLFTSDGAGSFVDNLHNRGGVMHLTRVASVGAQYRGIGTNRGYITLAGTCITLGCGSGGVQAESGSTIVVPGTLVALSHGRFGISSANSSTIFNPEGAAGSTLHARGNAGDGCAASNNAYLGCGAGSVSSNNAASGFAAGNGSTVSANNCTAGGNDAGFNALNNSFVAALNTTGANTSFGYVAFNGGNIVRTGGTATGATTSSPALSTGGNNNAFIS